MPFCCGNLRGILGLALILTCGPAMGAEEPAARTSLATITSSRDGSPQRVRYFIPQTVSQPVPLVVLLHSWSGDVLQDSALPFCAQECQRRGWAVVHPDFRGPNVRPVACASELAVQDVLDAVRWMEQQTRIDPRRRYVTGTSGGGHLTLIMAGRHPEVWAAASAWVPISDLAAWHADSVARNAKYADDLVAVCGGRPGASVAVDQQYRLRSPLTYLERSKGLPIDINAGITDGHNGSVPIRHSLVAFNLLARAHGHPDVQFSNQELTALTDRQEVPAADAAAAPNEPGRLHKVLVRRVAGPARVTIFAGGHEGDVLTALNWLGQHQRPASPPAP